MTGLSASLSDPLISLLQKAGQAPPLVDAAEVGPWFSPARIREYRALLPGLPFYFHAAGLAARVGWLPGTLRHFREYLDASGSAWLSLHLTFWPPGALALMLRYGVRLPAPQPERATRALVGKIERLKRALALPILLENLDPLPFPGCTFEVEPERISGIVQSTGCGLLLDTAHARLAAAVLGLAVEEYIARLPLERVTQVHVSGPRWRDGRLVDAHEPMEAEDYALLEWLLGRCNPKMVTLEYIREKEALAEQLGRLRYLLQKVD